MKTAVIYARYSSDKQSEHFCSGCSFLLKIHPA